MKKWIVVAAFLLLAIGASNNAYEHARWHCWQPGGGDMAGGYHHPYKTCDSQWVMWWDKPFDEWQRNPKPK